MKRNTPLISVIVPVYNVQSFLARCIRSILEQTYPHLEIILVDDGSSDRSGEICDRFATIDARIIVLHQQNMGLSGARNSGIEIAKGNYLVFIDSDDFILPTMIESLYNSLIRNNADISICSIQRVDENGIEIPSPSPFLDATLTKDEVLRNIINQKDGWTYIPAWNKLYRSFLFDNLRYPEKKLYEDGFIINELIYRSSRIATISQKAYCYTLRNTSIMNDSNIIRRLDGLESRYLQYQFYKTHKYLDCLPKIRQMAEKELYLIKLADRHATSLSEKKRIEIIRSLMKEIGARRSPIALHKDLFIFYFFSHMEKK